MTLLQLTVIDALGFIRCEAGASVGEISESYEAAESA
jgi:hypothetical protein